MERYEIYLAIMYRGLLDIRGNCEDGTQVLAQSDHLHNMPELLANLDKEELHDFYWNSMRLSYRSSCTSEGATIFDDLWAKLEQLRGIADSKSDS